MQRTLLAPLFLLMILGQAFCQDPSPALEAPQTLVNIPTVTGYKISFELDPPTHCLIGDATITIRNGSTTAIKHVPVLLYRLMDITTITGDQGKPLAFTHNIVKLPDAPTWQVNSIDLTLPQPLAPGASTTLRVRYGGPLLGLREVMQYVRDTIDEDYSLIREEPIPYPIVSELSNAGRRHFAWLATHIDLETVVPAGQIAVCVFPSVGEPQTANGKTTFHCAGEGQAVQINVAVAKFHILTDPARHFEVYSMPADAAEADRILGEMRRSSDFFTSYLGALPDQSGLKLVEIPEGWGSYGMRGTIFQAAAAFKDKGRAHELWHEVGHRWNACWSLDTNRACEPTVQRARWFDEAFASFFEALAIRQFNGQEAFQREMQASRNYFADGCKREPRGRTTPIVDYGKYEIGGFSYTKNASLYVLQQYLGEEPFRKAISDFLHEYVYKPANFEDFRCAVEKSSGKDIGAWYQQWMLSGSQSSDMLLEGKTVEEMVARVQAQK